MSLFRRFMKSIDIPFDFDEIYRAEVNEGRASGRMGERESEREGATAWSKYFFSFPISDL